MLENSQIKGDFIMNFSEFLEKAKVLLEEPKKINEDAGSEGLAYELEYKGSLPEKEGVKVEKLEDGKAKITFDYPRDCGLAAQELKDLGVEIVNLRLLF